MSTELLTPFEKGNLNQTTTHGECIAWYEDLARAYPNVLRFDQVGVSDAGVPIHAGVVSSDGVFGLPSPHGSTTSTPSGVTVNIATWLSQRRP